MSMLIRVWVSIFLLLGISYCDSFVEKKIHLNHECNSIKICYQYPDGCVLDKCEGGFTVARANLREPNYGTIYEIYVPILVEKSNYIAIESTNLKTGEKYVRLCLPNEKKAMFAYKDSALSIDETHVMEVVATMFSEEPYPATTICVFRDTVFVKQEEDEVFVSDVTTGVLSNDIYYPPKMTIQISGVTKLNFDLLDGVNLPGPVLVKDSEEEVEEAGLDTNKDEKKILASTTLPVQSLGNNEETSLKETVERTTVSGIVGESSVVNSNQELIVEEPIEKISVKEDFEGSTVRSGSKQNSSKESVKKHFIEKSAGEITLGEVSNEFTAEKSVEDTSAKGSFEESSSKESAKKKSEESVNKHFVAAEGITVGETNKELAVEEPIKEKSVEKVSEESTLEEGSKTKLSEESATQYLIANPMEEFSIEKYIEKFNDIREESRMTSSSPNLSVSSSSTIGIGHKHKKKSHPHKNFHNTSGQTRLTVPQSTEDNKFDSPEKSKQEEDDVMKDSVRAELRSLDIIEDEPLRNPTEPKRSQSYRQRDQFEKDYRNEKGKNIDYKEEDEEEGDDVEGDKEAQRQGREKEREGDNENAKDKSTESHPKNLHIHQHTPVGSEEDDDSASSCSVVLPLVVVLWSLV